MTGLGFLLENNRIFVEKYKKNSLVRLMKSHEMNQQKKREQLLDCIQVFSNFFQKTVMLRSVFTEDNYFMEISQKHLLEEFGHNNLLKSDRKNRPEKWDPVLDSGSCWFAWKMLSLDNADKALLIHFVLEASAHVFFKEAHRIMEKYSETDYFKIHSELDEAHESMGLALLDRLREADYRRLLEIQRQGWDVLNAVCDRITELTLKN